MKTQDSTVLEGLRRQGQLADAIRITRPVRGFFHRAD